jgi:hypothetical protein
VIAFEIAPGVTLRLGALDAAREEPESALPAIDVSAVPGARVVLRKGFEGPTVRVRVACVVAPSDRWAPGIEELVLGRATGLAIAGLGVPVERWDPTPIASAEGGIEQRVIGQKAGREAAVIRHVLHFVGPSHDILLCSIACAAPSCADVVAAADLDGPLVGPPPPSLLVRSALLAAAHPYEAALVALLLRRRAKVPGRRFYP